MYSHFFSPNWFFYYIICMKKRKNPTLKLFNPHTKTLYITHQNYIPSFGTNIPSFGTNIPSFGTNIPSFGTNIPKLGI